MQSYSQGQEDTVVMNHFGSYVGNILSIGENDGITYSNTHLMILNGWSATLVEPSPKAFVKLESNYAGLGTGQMVNVALGKEDGILPFWESGSHINENDTSLLSTLDENELKRWEGSGNTFQKIVVPVMSFDSFQKRCKESGYKTTYDFISLDAEGFDLCILDQMNLDELGCKCLCIEHNSDYALKENIKKSVNRFEGFEEIYQNGENIIYARK